MWKFNCLIVLLILSSCNVDQVDTATIFLLNEEQIDCRNQLTLSQEKFSGIQEMAQDKSESYSQNRARRKMSLINKSDAVALQIIKAVDVLKLEILRDFNEDITTIGQEKSIIKQKAEKNYPLSPIFLDLKNIRTAEKTSFITHSSKNGKLIIKSLKDYRTIITAYLATTFESDQNNQPYFFKSRDITHFKSIKEFNDQIDKEIDASNVALDDREITKQLYGILTHDVKEWQQLLNNNIPVPIAIGVLTRLQSHIFIVRGLFIKHLSYQIACCNPYIFDKLEGIIKGPECVNVGEMIDLEVFTAAYDSDINPIVSIENVEVIEVKAGKAFLRTKALEPGKLTLKGTITHFNRSGIRRTEPIEKTIWVRND